MSVTQVQTPVIAFENALVPTGAVFHFAASSAPAGYLKCNGNVVPNGTGTVQGITADFSALYNILGTTYGSLGKLPDLRGEFIRGWDAGRGVDDGRTFGSLQLDDFKSHTHNINNQTNEGPNWVAFSKPDINPPAANDGTGFTQGGQGNDRTFYITSSGGTETRPRNVALLACIKY